MQSKGDRLERMVSSTIMASGGTLKALFKVNECADRIDNIKRLALLFDECHYLPPETHPILLGEPIEGGLVGRRDAAGNLQTEPFEFFKHTTPGFTYDDGSIRDPELRATLAELREAKIAFPANVDHHEIDGDSLLCAKKILAVSEMNDEVFRTLSETTPEQFSRASVTTIHSVDQEGHEHKHHLVRAPNAIVDSYDLTDVLTTAHKLRACPIFLDDHHRAELKHRYDKMKEGAGEIARTFPSLGLDGSLRGSFGAVSFRVASEVFDRETIASRKVSDIIKYRVRMEDARKRYLSEDLMELTAIVETHPWGEGMQTEIERYVMGKLTKDLTVYRQTMRATWEKMFGSLAATAATAVRVGGAGGVLGELLPHTSLWEMAVLGTIGGLLKEAPSVAKTVIDSILAVRAQRRNAIAYVAELK